MLGVGLARISGGGCLLVHLQVVVVAACKMRKAQDRMSRGRPYSEQIGDKEIFKIATPAILSLLV